MGGTVILVIAVLYLLITMWIGLWASRHIKSSGDFFIAGRNIGMLTMAIAAFASIQSGFGVVGGVSQTFSNGLGFVVGVMFAAPLGFVLTWFLVGRRIWRLGGLGEIYTLGDVVAKRYRSEAVRFWLAIAIFLGVIGYLGTQVQAMGVVMQAIFGGPLMLGSFIGLALMAIYSAIGGIMAGVYTDLFQGILMVVAAVIVFFSALRAGGGVLEINQTLYAENPDLTTPFGLFPIITVFCWFLLFSLGAAGQPHFLTKFLMVRDEKELKWGAFTSGLAYMLSTLFAIGIGLAALSLAIKGEFPALDSPDQAMTVFLMEFTSPVVAGLVMAGLMAAIMSTGNSFVNLGAACLVRDVPKALGIRVRNELFWSRVVTMCLFILSFLFAAYMDTLVALLGVFGWGTFAAAIFPAVVLGLVWERATAMGAMSSIIVGVLLSFVLEVGAKYGFRFLPPGVINGTFAFVVSIAVFVGVSLLTQKRSVELEEPVRHIVNES